MQNLCCVRFSSVSCVLPFTFLFSFFYRDSPVYQDYEPILFSFDSGSLNGFLSKGDDVSFVVFCFFIYVLFISYS